jgi:hypothetical protein
VATATATASAVGHDNGRAFASKEWLPHQAHAPGTDAWQLMREAHLMLLSNYSIDIFHSKLDEV